MRRVVVTGIGCILPNCDSRQTFWRHIRDGQSQLEFEPDPGNPHLVSAIGRVRDFQPARYLSEVPERFYASYHREIQLYLASVFRARDDAGVDLSKVRPSRIGLFDGCSRAAFAYWFDRIREETLAGTNKFNRRDVMVGLPGQAVGIAASLLRVQGPTYTFAGSCAAGAVAIGHAWREIRDGEIDVALATGHESLLVEPVFSMYRDANLISLERDDPRRAIRPFGGYSANALAEGALTFVLEDREFAERRGATILASIEGYKYGNNGYHPTAVDASGTRPSEVLEELIGNTGVLKESIGFVVGHGNAVQLSDASEENYMARVFGERSGDVPLISTKPIYGHMFGAASAINIAAATLMLSNGYIIPTINVDDIGPRPGVNHQANVGIERQVDAGIALSYGMGGHNAAVMLGQNRERT